MKVSASGSLGIEESLSMSVHEGIACEYYYENLAFSSNTTLRFLIKVGLLPFHTIMSLEATGLTTAKMYRSPTFSADGTEITPLAFNELIALDYKTKVFLGPTVSDNGALMFTKSTFGSSNGANRVSSEISSGVHRILKPNTNYLLAITTATNNSDVRLSILAHEENT